MGNKNTKKHLPTKKITRLQILKAEEVGTLLFKVYCDQVWYNTGCKVTIMTKCTAQMFLLDVINGLTWANDLVNTTSSIYSYSFERKNES